MPFGRIRVLVAGDIYANPSLVRPFLEDDGYDVVADAPTRDDVLPAVTRLQPDAVVIDERLLPARRNGKLLQKVRRAAPDAKVVVVAARAGPASRSAAVDATIEQGTSLAALSAVLGRLFAEDGSRVTLAAAGVGATDGAARATGPTDARGATRFVVTVGAPLLVVWALIAMLATGGAPLAPAGTTDLAGPLVIVPHASDPLEDARDVLDRLIDAIEAGTYPLAAVYAETLMEQRESAISRGYVTAGLDEQIEAALAGVAGSLPGYAIDSLQRILGVLFPVLESEQTAGGSSVLFGSSVGTGSGTGETENGDGDGGTAGGGGGGGDDDGDGGIVVTLGPGDGREWGQSHKLTKGDGGPPPWAHGHGGDPPGRRHGHGLGNGGGAGA